MTKIAIATETNFWGKILINQFKSITHEIVVFTTGKTETLNTIKYINWIPSSN
ncbi:hypothetical protein E0W72_07475 [Flavobacterium arcticum]|uniref:hypothetical protein n=1 Tax=Flavobacterium arcticum TaxID=1784713 RepID=UPI0013C36C0D|nr:hypothetical protein [Flavobacterium arcticum]KAF2510315.1 hypothetical protein E0W72_07475 [Flavobacterium arcticum]